MARRNCISALASRKRDRKVFSLSDDVLSVAHFVYGVALPSKAVVCFERHEGCYWSRRCQESVMKLMAETVIWRILREAGVPVHRMGTQHAVTWVDVFLDHSLERFESEWQPDSVAATVAADLLSQ